MIMMTLFCYVKLAIVETDETMLVAIRQCDKLGFLKYARCCLIKVTRLLLLLVPNEEITFIVIITLSLPLEQLLKQKLSLEMSLVFWKS